jgi:hypothetical protein
MQIYDKLWKGAIEDLIVDFLRFFYVDADNTFDFSKKPEFLDKELEELFPDQKNTTRHVDKLVKVWLKDGSVKWILIHCEVQGYNDKDFELRMFIYFYRIFDKYNVDISSIAILSDDNPLFKPEKFEKKFLGTVLTFKFNTFKILEIDPSVLEASDNPFAIIILTVYYALIEKIKRNKLNKKKGNEEEADESDLINIKLDLVRRLKNKKFDNKTIRALFYFIKNYIRFANSENNRIFENELEKIYPHKNRKMGVVDILIEAAKIEGRLEGEIKGKIEGEIKGKLEGKIENITEIIYNASLQGLPLDLIAKIVKLPVSEVQAILFKMGFN